MTGCGDSDPVYGAGRVYIVGNVFHHINSNGLIGTGQAISIGNQVDARIVNNTIYKCLQGVTITGTHFSGECPSGGDPNNESRNTRVAIWNNVFLDMLDDASDSHVRVTTGPPNRDFTLTDAQFDRNLHYGDYRLFRLPSGTHSSVEGLQDDGETDYGANSKGDDTGAHNPHLLNPGQLKFFLTGQSPPFMSTNGVRDVAYDDFEEAFDEFPHIFRDFKGDTYNSNGCAVGAFGS